MSPAPDAAQPASDKAAPAANLNSPNPYSANPNSAPAPSDLIEVNLRDPFLAGFLAWLIPGAGHFYQRRWGKGGLFMVCILGTFFVGLWMGQGRVVYASLRDRAVFGNWKQDDMRYFYFCQVGVGLPALPAMVQSLHMKGDAPKAPLWNGFMAPPLLLGQRVPREWAKQQVAAGEFDSDEFPDLKYQRPADYVTYLFSEENNKISEKAGQQWADPYSQLSTWNYRMGQFFEIGTIYTVIAGLLNVLAIYDACCGPMLIASGESDDEEDDEKKEKEKKP